MNTLIATGGEHTLWSLVLQADPVVKGVMIILVLASVACWAIIFEKIVRIWRLNRSLRRLEQSHAGDIDHGVAGAVLKAGSDEYAAVYGDGDGERRHRVETAMRSELKFQLHRLEKGLPFLATTGSASPFIGLFGTVWGIVNSFTAIAQQKDTSLAVVAPGIAEALIATALGLAAAIPAVVAYNQISVALGRAYARGNEEVVRISREFVPGEGRPETRTRSAKVQSLR